MTRYDQLPPQSPGAALVQSANPAELLETLQARGYPDVCLLCRGVTSNWTRIGNDTVTGKACYLCGECASEVKDKR